MTLEDHLGDIVRKARMMAAVSVEAAATAAGLSTAGLKSLEQTGQCAKASDLSALADLIGLNAEKLQGIANGWTPEPADLNQWRRLRVITTSDEDMAVNCFLIWDEATREAALFDTGFDAAPVLREIQANQLQLRHIFITHSHSDHVEGLPVLRQQFPAARLHMDGPGGPGTPGNRRDESVQLGCLNISHRATPGHADDGVTYVVRDWPDNAPPVAIVGDALFAGSMGRALGAREVACRAVLEEVLSLPGPTLLCPGHGPLTTVRQEVAHNPFF